MRVLGGSARGRRLKSVPGDATRPPLARVRQAVFNILQTWVAGSAWLDLFSGTGSFGIEALSRGAEWVVMVELNPRALAVIHDNLSTTGLSERATVIAGDVLKEIPRLASKDYRFSIIGVTPPYFRGFGPKVLELLDRHDLLEPGGRVFVQRHQDEDLPARTARFELARDYRYGETLISLYLPRSDADRPAPGERPVG